MSWKKSLAKVFLLAGLEIGALMGAPIRPEQIEEIMKLSQPAVIQVMRTDQGEPLADESDQAFFT